MAITTKNRKDLKSYFVKNAIPTQGNFAELIEAQLNQSDDGVFKLPGEPLSVVAASGEQKRVLRFYSSYPAANPDWLISLNPAQDPGQTGTGRQGFGIADGAGNTRLFINAAGNLGLGTNEPQGAIDVRVAGSPDPWHRFVVNTTNAWGGSKGYVTIGAGGADGIMFANPHVAWYEAEKRASIRYGRISGKGGETWWDVGARPDGSFALDANENGGAGADLLRVTKTGNVGIRTSDPQGALDIHLPEGTAPWNRFVVNTTNTWDGGSNRYVTIGTGGVNGLMILSPSVPWYAPESRASIRYGRANGKSGETWWDVGARSDGSFSLDARDNNARNDWVFRATKTGHAEVFGNFDVGGSVGLGWARGTADFNAPLRTGFYQWDNPAGRVPDTSHGWVHMIAVRHSSPENHHQLQIASSYAENDKLYFRKIARGLNDNSRSAWNEIATVARMPKIRMGVVQTANIPRPGPGVLDPREVRISVDFGYQFASAPNVVVCLSSLDTFHDANLRINSGVRDITTTGCTVWLHTWGDTVVYSASATWIAIGV